MQDPVRSFTGREKYKRQLWATDALENPTVVSFQTFQECLFFAELNMKNITVSDVLVVQSVQQMVMLSTSVLNIKWTLRGKPSSPIFSIGGDLIVKVNSIFILNQISGQVIEHEELWDLSESSIIAQAYFWASRRLFATVEAGKDVSDSIKDLTNRVATQNRNVEMYPDPTVDPTKVESYFQMMLFFHEFYLILSAFLTDVPTHFLIQFFQRDDSFQRDFYQIALFLAVVYFVVQFLRTTL